MSGEYRGLLGRLAADRNLGRLRKYRQSQAWGDVPLDLKLAILEALGEIATEDALSAPTPTERREDVTREEIERLRNELRGRGEEHGYGTLAARLGTSEATIRRRLGLIK